MKTNLQNKVAICIPYFNSFDTLKRLIESIKIQDYSNYIVIVTDDGNDDKARNLVESYNFEYYRNEIRLGATANCNKAIGLAEKHLPQYIKVMHQDDYFVQKESLRIMVGMLDANPYADLAFTGTRQDDGIEPYERCISPSENVELENDSNYLLYANVIGGPSSVIVRNKSIKLDEKLIWLVDVDWYIKILKLNKNYVCTTKPLIGIGINERQLTNTYNQNKLLVLKEYAYLYYKLFASNSSIELKTIMEKLYWSLCDNVEEEMENYHNYDIAIWRDRIHDGKPLVIFGAGKNGRGIVYQKLRQMGGNIVCFCDNDTSLWGKQIVDGVNCVSLSELVLYSSTVYCLVSTTKGYLEIKQQLEEADIEFCMYDFVREICQF